MVAVKYKYKNESEVMIDKADDFEIKDIGKAYTRWQAVGAYYDVEEAVQKQFISGQRLSPTDSISEQISYDSSGNAEVNSTWHLGEPGSGITLKINRVKSPGVQTKVFTTLEEMQKGRVIGRPLSYGLYPPVMSHWYYPRNQYGQYDFSTRIYVGLNPVLYFWWGSSAETQYRLNIFKGNNQVFTRTELYRPEYVQVIGGCPQGTCPVLCGDKACCYGSDGIAVSSYQY
jgi:hypothetical protein